ncbi:MAG: flagellar hook-associated protein FlgK [Myxococcota bacterium]|nr:flagellar hook-associated protein FlgK [Myxococcota bacterium]
MAGMISNLGSAKNTLLAQQTGLMVTGHNIANATTEGFHRQEVLTESLSGNAHGISLDRVRRHTDFFLNRQMMVQGGEVGYANARQEYIAQIDPVLGDLGEGGLNASLDRFFSNWNELSANPENLDLRTELLYASDSIVTVLNRQAYEITKARDDANDDLEFLVAEVNSKLGSVADLNKAIIEHEAHGEDANELKDHRDKLADELASLIGVKVFQQDDGTVRLLIANGMAMVDRDVHFAIALQPQDTDDDGVLDGKYFDVVLENSIPIIINSRVKGEIGGALHFRDTDAVGLMTLVDELAYDLGTEVNAIHETGFGLDDSTGLAFFTGLGTTASGAAKGLALNTDIASDGQKIAASGESGAVGDGANALRLAQLDISDVAHNNSRTLAESSNFLLANFTALKRTTTSTQEGFQQRYDLLSNLQMSNVGVSVEEEMVVLNRYQRAFHSTTKVIKTLDEMIQVVLGMKG